MSPRLLIALAVALAAVPPAYAGLVYLWQLVSFAGFAVRMEDPLPGEAGVQTIALVLRTIGIAVALFVVGRGALRANWGPALLALVGAWVIGAPVLLLLVRG